MGVGLSATLTHLGSTKETREVLGVGTTLTLRFFPLIHKGRFFFDVLMAQN